MATKAGIDPLFTRERMALDADDYLGDRDPSDPVNLWASPARASLASLPPLLIQVGSHVFQNFTGRLDEADEALDRAGAFIRRHLPVPVTA